MPGCSVLHLEPSTHGAEFLLGLPTAPHIPALLSLTRPPACQLNSALDLQSHFGLQVTEVSAAEVGSHVPKWPRKPSAAGRLWR